MTQRTISRKMGWPGLTARRQTIADTNYLHTKRWCLLPVALIPLVELPKKVPGTVDYLALSPIISCKYWIGRGLLPRSTRVSPGIYLGAEHADAAATPANTKTTHILLLDVVHGYSSTRGGGELHVELRLPYVPNNSIGVSGPDRASRRRRGRKAGEAGVRRGTPTMRLPGALHGLHVPNPVSTAKLSHTQSVVPGMSQNVGAVLHRCTALQ